jgi:hypothetical protein
MGIIDRISFSLTCPTCEKTESSTAYQKGSRWGASWGDQASFLHFTTQWSGGGNEEPKLEKAICNQCRSNAKIEESYK